MPTDAASRALHILRDGSQFQWHVIPIMMVVLYIYATEIERKNWNVVFAGLALWGMDWFNEIWNGLVFHFTQHAPVWGTPGGSAYVILIGLNIEICFMFAIMGIVVAKTLPADRTVRILGLPNRWVVALAASLFCVVIEYLLNAVGALTWDYWWWNRSTPWLIFVFGYLTFFVVAFWVHDIKTMKGKLAVVGTIWAIVIASLVLFIPILHWI